MKKILSLIVIVVLVTSCKDKGASQTSDDTDIQEKEQNQEQEKIERSWYKPQKQVIEGTVIDGANANIILDQLSIGEINPIISVLIDENDRFKIETAVIEPGIYQLRFANANIHLFLRGGHVTVNTDISDIGSYEIIGSDESYQLREMYLLLNETNHKTTEVQDRVDKLKEQKKTKQLVALIDSLPIYYAAINEEKAKNLKEFITKIDTSMVGVLAAMYLNADYNYDYLIEVRDKYEKICPNAKIFKQFNDKLSSVIPVGRGHEAPDVIMDDYNDEEHALTDLRGNYSLLYFWAAYSNPSREDNRKLKELYQEYSDKGFSIYAVSLDEDKGVWKDAIIEDGITEFIHGSNLVGWQDEISFIYKIEGVPYYILIDKEGIIIDRGFKIHELEEKLNSLY